MLSLLLSQPTAQSLMIAQLPVNQAQQKILRQILKNNPRINQKYAHKLAKVIVSKSVKYKIPARTLTAILMQESAYNLSAKNITCGIKTSDSDKETCIVTDFGISQIHYKNIKRFGFNKKRLVTDLDYSVDSGAKVLATYSRYSKTEPKSWYSRYNCGVKSKSYLRDECILYKSRVDRYM